MLLTYLWQFKGLSGSTARKRFHDILNKQRDLYRDAWGHAPDINIVQVMNVMIGQIRLELGIHRWYPWMVHGSKGVVWGGVCEKFLGCKFDLAEITNLQSTLFERPKDLCSWDGRFCVTAWCTDTQRLSLTTGAIESPSLWYTEGPNGWAVGSRAAPLLHMVNRTMAPSLRDVGLFLGHGYLFGDGSLFEHVHRLKTRHQVLFDERSKPTIRTYASIMDCLSTDGTSMARQDAVSAAASRIVERVNRQLQYSQEPLVLLTGGRDSRSIAAAAQKSGFPGPAHTGGMPGSADVRIAGDVADRLRVTHQHGYLGDLESRAPALINAPEYLELWTQLSEGLETIRHATSYQSFFDRGSSPPVERRPLFHGLGGEIGRAFYYSKAHAAGKVLDGRNAGAAQKIIVDRKAGDWAVIDKSARESTMEILEQFNSELGSNVSAAQWLDSFYWQNKCLHWGEDMLSVKSPTGWHWTPLLDGELMRVYWNVSSDEKMSSRFVEEVILTMAPALEGAAYDHEISTRPSGTKALTTRLLSRSKKYARKVLPSGRERAPPELASQNLLRLWDSVLFTDGPRIWSEFVDETSLRAIIKKKPSSAVLWNMATVEIFAATHCASSTP